MSAAILLAAGIASFAGVQPQLAAGGGAVYVTFAAADAISVARSTDAGATFTTPVILPGAGKLALGRHRGPRVAATRDAVIVAAIAGARGGGADGDVVLYRSVDRGRTWSPSTVINDVPGAAREGLHALAANDAGLVVVAWLDLRDKGTRLYAATSRDHGATWSPDALVYASPSGRFASAAIRRWRSTTPTASRCCSATTSTGAATCTSSSRATARLRAGGEAGHGVVAARRLPDGRRRDRGSRRDGPHGVAPRDDDLRRRYGSGSCGQRPRDGARRRPRRGARHRGRAHRRGVDRRCRCPAPPAWTRAAGPRAWRFRQPAGLSRRTVAASSTRAASPSTSWNASARRAGR